jgi:uncharacterized protein YyaL (SSP411 family)
VDLTRGLTRGPSVGLTLRLTVGLTVGLASLGPSALGVAGCGATAHETARRASQPAPRVRWREGTAAPFEEAAREGRLVLLSVQAGWCHWCHVMNDTTYRDPAVVALLDERFVTVRAEADARPDLADRYGAWGWPATIVLTSDGREIAAARGYRDPRALRALLERALEDPRPRDLFAEGAAAEGVAAERTTTGLTAAVEAARAQLDATYDAHEEGWGRPQKYPFTAPVLLALHREAPWPERAERSLERYTRLIDPVWGGMYQYSEQGDWAHPHFERIASVQAGALEALAELARRTGDTTWLAQAQEVVRFLRDFLRAPGGAFRASMDADLRVEGGPFVPGADYFARDDAGRRALGLPRIDPSLYASTQGTLAVGLARFAAALPLDDARRQEALSLALDAVSFAGAELRAPSSLLYVHETGHQAEHQAGHEPGHDAGREADGDTTLHLADQVAMLRALLAIQHATGERRHAEAARELADALERAFCETERGCRSTDRGAGAGLAVFEPRVPLEENGRLAQALAAVADLAGERGYEERARRYLEAAATPAAIRSQGRIVGDFLLGAELLGRERPIAHVIGPADDPRTLALFEAALSAADLRTRVERAAPGEGRYPYPGEPSLFACSLSACAAPVTDPARVAEALRSFSSDP